MEERERERLKEEEKEQREEERESCREKDKDKDILICIVIFPNDPTRDDHPHQFFVYEINASRMILFSISSRIARAIRYYDNPLDPYFHIDAPLYQLEGFKKRSMIDCTKGYIIDIENLNIERLSWRVIKDPAFKEDLLEKINRLKAEHRLHFYTIHEKEFKEWNRFISWKRFDR